jgi:hypothetical protein
MLTRRAVLLHTLAGSSLAASLSSVLAQTSADNDELLTPMDSLPIDDLTKKHPFGSHPASRDEVAKADVIIANTPTGPRPIDIAQSLVTRFYASRASHPN